MVVVGNYFPLGLLPPMTDQLKKDMETATQKDLGTGHYVRLIYTKMDKNELIEILITPKK